MVTPTSAARAGKYRFIRALRPFSFPVALVTCLIGVVLAARQVPIHLLESLMVLAGGVLLQAGVNLINDYADIRTLRHQPDADRLIVAVRRNFRAGMGCFLIAAVIGLYFVAQQGLGFLLLCVLGLLGALGYTLSPINYKSRGLGVVLVFWLMGILMIAGSAVALGAELNAALVLQSVPVSVLVSLLLLSNELRDYEQDRHEGLETLTVRIGYTAGARLYRALLALAYLSVALLLWLGLLPGAFWVLLSLPLVRKPLRLLGAPASLRTPITPATARVLLGFGLLFCLALINPWPLPF